MDKKSVKLETGQELRLSELLILAVLWMVFGFMLWYYLSAFHGVPVRLIANEILTRLLGSEFWNIVPNPDRHYLFQVQTRIPFRFPDGSEEALGFIVNPLVYGYGLPLLFGLVMASGVSFIRKMITLLQLVSDAGISDELIALCYQLGVLIFPPLVPVILWVLANWELIEQFTGWQKNPE